MPAVKTHVAFENNFVLILDEQKFYEGISNPILIKTLRIK